jgi:hypothetical protein
MLLWRLRHPCCPPGCSTCRMGCLEQHHAITATDVTEMLLHRLGLGLGDSGLSAEPFDCASVALATCIGRKSVAGYLSGCGRGFAGSEADLRGPLRRSVMSARRGGAGRGPLIHCVIGVVSIALVVALLPEYWSRGFGVGLDGTRFAPLPTAIYLIGGLASGAVFLLAEARCMSRSLGPTIDPSSAD